MLFFLFILVTIVLIGPRQSLEINSWSCTFSCNYVY